MELNLTIDRGNTALKVALWGRDNRMVRQTVSFDPAGAADLARSILEPGDTVAAAIYCSVVSAARGADMESLAAFCPRVIDLDCNTPMPLRLCYGTPETLGADRIAAAVGARDYAGGRPAMVADVGTAVTYDFVDAKGYYLGGNIAPGVSMRLAALHAHTSALPEVDTCGNTPLWGSSTEEALRSGALRGVAAELDYYRRAAGPDAVTVLTGGSSRLLAKAGIIDFDYIHDPYLVHRGLNCILRYNEII